MATVITDSVPTPEATVPVNSIAVGGGFLHIGKRFIVVAPTAQYNADDKAPATLPPTTQVYARNVDAIAFGPV
jgi:hypothetical protein